MSLEEEYHMILPQLTTYIDGHVGSMIPPLSMEHLTTYLSSNSQLFNSKCRLSEIERDDAFCGETEMIDKLKKFYDEHFAPKLLEIIRV